MTNNEFRICGMRERRPVPVVAFGGPILLSLRGCRRWQHGFRPGVQWLSESHP